MEVQVPKSIFKLRSLHYLREVERSGKSLIITDRGKPVLKIVPYSDGSLGSLQLLKNSVIEYEEPTEPVGLNDWDSLA